MIYFLRLLMLIGAVVLVIAIIGSLLPRAFDFETSTEVNATPAEIFPLVNDLSQWPKWSRQFNTEDIDGLEIQYGATTTGVGAAQTWTDIRGEGKLWITDSLANESIDYDLKFTNFPVMKSSITLEPSDGKTKIVWRSQGSLPGGPFYGFFGNFFSTHMRDQYQKSLTRLKTVVE